MNRLSRLYPFLIAALTIPHLIAIPARAIPTRGGPDDDRPREGEYRSESPYFHIEGGSGEHFPLESTDVEINVAGVIADVVVKQVYRNRGEKPIEGTYIFPASTRAAVHGMVMRIGDREIVAKVKEKQEARTTYETAKREGKTASLLEEHRPNVFQMNVANILPGDRIEVELSYTEMLVPTDRIYELVFPTVVGPRFEGESGLTTEKWVSNPYLHPAAKQTPSATPAFDLHATIHGGMALSDVTSPSHPVDIQFQDETACTVALKRGKERADNRDVVLRYRLAGDTVNTGLLLHEGEKENFFTAMILPPARTTLADVPARDYVFIVDISGSMSGFPLEVSKELLSDLIGSLRPVDTFNVLLFAGSTQQLAPAPLPATAENINKAIHIIDNHQGGGGTRILTALERALALPKGENVSRSIVVATDGLVTVEPEAFDLIRRNLNQANLFVFGIGRSVNRHLIEGMARVGRGESFVALDRGEARANAKRFRQYVSHPVLTNATLAFEGFEVYDVEPPTVSDVLADRPVVIVGKWRGKPEGKIILEGQSGTGAFTKELAVADYVTGDSKLPALPFLWARERIGTLVDYNMLTPDDARVEEATKLGLTYNLLTPYTSFVAVDEIVRTQEGTGETVRQPTPLPSGVSPMALGAGHKVATTPEPETWGLLIIGAGVLAWIAFRRPTPPSTSSK